MRTGGRSQAAWGASGDAPRAQPRAHPTGRAGRAPASARAAHGALRAPTRSQRRVRLGRGSRCAGQWETAEQRRRPLAYPAFDCAVARGRAP